MPSPIVAHEDLVPPETRTVFLRPLKVLEASVLLINATTDDVIFFGHSMMQFSAQLVLIFGIRVRRQDRPGDDSLCFDERLYCVLKRVVSASSFYSCHPVDSEGVPCV